MNVHVGGRELGAYQRIAGQIARCMMRSVRGSVDALAMGVDDYEADLVTHAWVKLCEWRRCSPPATRDEQLWVCKCLWNRARTAIRRRLRVQIHSTRFVEVSLDDAVDATFETRAICRETLRLLRTKLPKRDWQILCQVAVDEGDRHPGSSRKEQRTRQRVKGAARRVSLFLESGVRRCEDPMRRALEREASTLGIAWTAETTDDELAARIRLRKESGMSSTAPSEFPPCYGVFWEAIPGTEACLGCAVQAGCLHRFATERLPLVRSEVGEDLAAIAAATEVKPNAILLAMAHLQKQKQPAPPPAAMPEAPAAPPPPLSQAIANPFDEGAPPAPPSMPAAPMAVPPVEEDPPIVQSERPSVPIRIETEPDAEEVKVPKKKKAPAEKAPAEKKPPKKKAPAKVAPAVTNPPAAGAAKRATAPASLRATAKKSPAQPAKAQASARPPRGETPEQKNLRRWIREREKHPEFGAATPGTTLKGEHKGNPWEVKVLRGRYLYQNQEYGTLQAVCTAITGTVKYPKQLRVTEGGQKLRPKGGRAMSNWSAKRFFARSLAELAGR